MSDANGAIGRAPGGVAKGARVTAGLVCVPWRRDWSAMRAAVTVGVISLIAAGLMIRSAGRTGFTVFEVPLVVMELMFLAALYLLWRVLAGGEDASESGRRPAASQRGAAPSHRQSSHRPRSRAVPERGLRLRLSGWADWWFNGLRDLRER